MKRSLIAPVLVGVIVLVAWIVLTSGGIVGSAVLPKLGDVFQRIYVGFAEGYLASAALVTIGEAFLGCLCAATIGIPLGFAIAHWQLFARATEPYLAASQAIPAVAVAPLLVIWIGYGRTPIVVLCTFMVIFPIIIATATGVRGVNPDVIGAARIDGASGLTLLTRIEAPMAMSAIMAGVRTGFTLSVTGAVVGEMVIGGQNGLGIQLVTAQHLGDIAGMFATIVILALVAVTIYLSLSFLEQRFVLE